VFHAYTNLRPLPKPHVLGNGSGEVSGSTARRHSTTTQWLSEAPQHSGAARRGAAMRRGAAAVLRHHAARRCHTTGQPRSARRKLRVKTNWNFWGPLEPSGGLLKHCLAPPEASWAKLGLASLENTKGTAPHTQYETNSEGHLALSGPLTPPHLTPPSPKTPH
jgi:hypothetical protein